MHSYKYPNSIIIILECFLNTFNNIIKLQARAWVAHCICHLNNLNIKNFDRTKSQHTVRPIPFKTFILTVVSFVLKRKGRIEEEELRKEVVIRNKEFQEKYKKEIEEAEAAARY